MQVTSTAIKKYLLLLVVLTLVFSSIFSILVPEVSSAIPVTLPPKVTGNLLLQISQQCHDMQNLSTACSDMQNQLQSALGCSGNMFFQATNNSFDKSVKGLWYTDEGNFKDCYNKASSQLAQLSTAQCATLIKNSTNWNSCQNAQNALTGSIACSGNMFTSTDGTHYYISKSHLSSCKSTLTQIGNLHLIIIGPNGKTIHDPNAISSSAVTTSSGGNGSASGNTAAAGGSTAHTCDTSGFPLSWVFCSIITGLADAIDGIYEKLIEPLLLIKPIDLSNSNNPPYTHKIWSNFRVYGDIFLVIALLVIVFGESIGGGMIDAYTAKKVLPRLLLAAVLINLSIYLVALAVDISNIIGIGISNLISSPFQSIQGGYKLHISGTGGVLGTGAMVTAVFAGIASAGGFLALLLTGILLPAFLIFIAILVTLVIRQGLVLLLLFASPVAFALYCLPNTEQYFKKWWNLLFRTLLVYPIIGALFAIANVLSVTLSGIGGAFDQVIAAFALFAPLLMIPFAFRMSGGLIGQLHQATQQRIAAPGLERLKGIRQRRSQQYVKDLSTGHAFKGSNPISNRLNRTTRGIANIGAVGVTPWKAKSRFGAGLSTAKMQEQAEYMEKNAAFKAIMGSDDYMQATMKNLGGGDKETDWRNYLMNEKHYSAEDADAGVAAIRAAKRGTNDEVFKQAAVVANSSTGTGWKEGGAGAMMESINEAAGGDRNTAARMLAEMRQRAGQARRIDLSGAGFGGQLSNMNAMYENSQDPSVGMTAAQATRLNNTHVLEIQGPQAISTARGDSMKLLAPQMLDDLNSAYASGDNANIKRSVAKVANMYDTMSYASPENAKLFADQVLSKPFDNSEVEVEKKNARGELIQVTDAGGRPVFDPDPRDPTGKAQIPRYEMENTPLTARRVMERFRDDDEFLNMRKEWSVRDAASGRNRPPEGPEG